MKHPGRRRFGSSRVSIRSWSPYVIMMAMLPPYSRAHRIASVISCLTLCFASSFFSCRRSSSPIEGTLSVYHSRVASSLGPSMIRFAM